MYCNFILMYFILFYLLGLVVQVLFCFLKACLQDISECRPYTTSKRKNSVYISP